MPVRSVSPQRPAGAPAAVSIAAGADCFVVDAETAYEGRYAPAQRYMAALRAVIGPDYPVSFPSFPSATTPVCRTRSSSDPAERRPTCRRSTASER